MALRTKEDGHLVDSFLHLHQAQVGKLGLDDVHYGLQAVMLHDQELVASQQTQAHLEDDLRPLEEQHIYKKTTKLSQTKTDRGYHSGSKKRSGHLSIMCRNMRRSEFRSHGMERCTYNS